MIDLPFPEALASVASRVIVFIMRIARDTYFGLPTAAQSTSAGLQKVLFRQGQTATFTTRYVHLAYGQLIRPILQPLTVGTFPAW